MSSASSLGTIAESSCSPSASLPTPPPPPPRRPHRRSVTFAESPPKTPRYHVEDLPEALEFLGPGVATLEVNMPWAPPSPGYWSQHTDLDKPEYVS